MVICKPICTASLLMFNQTELGNVLVDLILDNPVVRKELAAAWVLAPDSEPPTEASLRWEVFAILEARADDEPLAPDYSQVSQHVIQLIKPQDLEHFRRLRNAA